MNFWEAQQRARSKTKVYLVVFVLLTLGMAALIELALHHFMGDAYQPPAPYVGLIFLGITFLVAFFQYSAYRTKGGGYVAESMGARRVSENTTNPRERQLLNIVEEMAVAASVPVPAVYIMDGVEQINAFAAGLTPEKAAVAVTDGTMNLLNREELQGVIGHEFGHIYNGDMKISLRLAAMVMGFMFVLYMGMRALQFTAYQPRRSSGNGRGGNPIALIALVLLGAGAITWFAGNILKSMVSREREYLADACAVQFTRNPQGIANALRKIGSLPVKGHMPASGMAYSHMYFSHKSLLGGLFATHPPLKKRIAAIEGREYSPDVE